MSSNFENIILEKKDSIAYVTLNRPQVLNALNRDLLAELDNALQDIRDDSAIQGVIITGSGDKAFAAGADIKEMSNDTVVQAKEKTQFGQSVTTHIENLGKPVIAAVNGFALGGGCEIAMACTFRIASDHAKFGQPEVKLGLIPGYGGTQRLPRLVGKGRALQLILSGEMIDAKEAYRIGLVNEIIDSQNLINRAEILLKQIIANAPISIKLAIEATNKGLETSLDEGLIIESSLFAICFGTEDRKEGTSAFINKRQPKFQDR
ncbi:MAG: enoyl-CoA hydratase-related protein [Legionellales bacterium]